MRSSILLACLLRSRRRFKVLRGEFHSAQRAHTNNQSYDHLSPKGLRPLRDTSQGPPPTTSSSSSSRPAAAGASSTNGAGNAAVNGATRNGKGRTQQNQFHRGHGVTKRAVKMRVSKKPSHRKARSQSKDRLGSSSSSGDASGNESSSSSTEVRIGFGGGPAECIYAMPSELVGGKAYIARRRDPRVNGADIYIARITKSGCGNARPCWRCLEWCKWAGVKRIFHWNEETCKFDVVKVNSAPKEQYETHADNRLFAGLVSRSSPVFYVLIDN